MLARTDSRARALVLLIVVTLLATMIGARLVWWQVVEREWLAELALNQLAEQHSLPAERGEITDRNGELLATSVEVQSVFVTPPSIEDPGLASALLASALDMPAADVRARIDNDRPWVFLKRRISSRGRRAHSGARHPWRGTAARDEARLPGCGRRLGDDARRPGPGLRRQ